MKLSSIWRMLAIIAGVVILSASPSHLASTRPISQGVAICNETAPGVCVDVNSDGALETTTTSTTSTSSPELAPVAPATATATKSTLAGGQSNSTPPAFTDGQQGSLQLGGRGSLRVEQLVPGSTSVVQFIADNADGVAASATVDEQVTAGKPYIFNGSTWDRAFTCPSTAVINVAAAATTELVALTASQIIRVCSFAITVDTAATTATFVYGTGTNCATAPASITGAMRFQDEGGMALSAPAGGSLFRTIASNALCLTAATGAVTGFITYAKY